MAKKKHRDDILFPDIDIPEMSMPDLDFTFKEPSQPNTDFAFSEPKQPKLDTREFERNKKNWNKNVKQIKKDWKANKDHATEIYNGMQLGFQRGAEVVAQIKADRKKWVIVIISVVGLFILLKVML